MYSPLTMNHTDNKQGDETMNSYSEMDYEPRDPEYSNLVDELEDAQIALEIEFEYE